MACGEADQAWGLEAPSEQALQALGDDMAEASGLVI